MPSISPIASALLSAFCIALLAILYRVFSVAKGDAWVLAFLNSLAGGLILLPFFPELRLHEVTVHGWRLLLLSGGLWTLMMYCDIAAYETLDATLNAILNATRLIVLMIIGALFFDEHLGALHAAGAALILASIAVAAPVGVLTHSSGTRFRIVSVLSGAAALTVDRHLTTFVPFEVVVLSGYFLPALAYAALKPRTVMVGAAFMKKQPLMICSTSLIFAVVGVTLVHGLAGAGLAVTLLIQRSSVFFIFLMALFLLGEREAVVRRAAAAALSVSGAALVALG